MPWSTVHRASQVRENVHTQMSLIYTLWKSMRVLSLDINNVSNTISWWPEDKCHINLQDAHKRGLRELQIHWFYCSPWESNEMCPSKSYYKQNQRPWWRNTSMYLQKGVVDHLLQQNSVLHGHRDNTGCRLSGPQQSVWCTFPQSSPDKMSNYRSDVLPMRWG